MPKLIQEWVTQQAEQQPDKTAIVWKGRELTYAELDRLTNQLAELLKEGGCNKGDRIAFCIPKSPEAIISMVGALKADCVYVPIDTECPATRVTKVIESCRPTWILTTKAAAKMINEVCADKDLCGSIHIGTLDDGHIEADNFTTEFCRPELENFSAASMCYQNVTSDAAHILFTSGSTGTPKGVVITHEMVVSFVEWGVEYLGIDESDRVSGHAPLHFDLSTFDTYGAFAAGAELHPVPPELNLIPHKIADFIRKAQLTQWFSVPSILNYMCKFDVVKDGDFPSLKRLMWCGEVLPTPTLIYFMQRLPLVQFTNLYGPTEATIASSYYTMTACPESETEQVPIGVACGSEFLLVLDEKHNEVPVGEIGDLYIGGIGLSPGYWRDQEKTDSVFINTEQHGRIYKTGDLSRLDNDGLIYFLGRADTQIKSRGYRIELGEIETALCVMSILDESAVVAIDRDSFENKTICCAYVPRPGSTVTVNQIKKELVKSVPKYMVPTAWMEFEQLPKNANGKIHRPQLREKFTEQQNGESAGLAASATK